MDQVTCQIPVEDRKFKSTLSIEPQGLVKNFKKDVSQNFYSNSKMAIPSEVGAMY